MSTACRIAPGEDIQEAISKMAGCLADNVEALDAMVGLIEGGKASLEDLMDLHIRAQLEAALLVSACGLAGPRHQGRKGGKIRRHGTQRTPVKLWGRKLRVRKPRLRLKGKGKGAEVAIPLLEALQEGGEMGGRILAAMMKGVSARSYGELLDGIGDTAGVSRSSVSRRFAEQSALQLEALEERRFDGEGGEELLAIFIDGISYGEHQVICAAGIDAKGVKRFLGAQEGSSENAESVAALLEGLAGRGLGPARSYLFVIDGSKALRAGILRVFGEDALIQRCRRHKERNVCDKLPGHLAEEVKPCMRAAWGEGAEEGIKRLKRRAGQLQRWHPEAAASLLEGLEETFTLNRLGLPDSLRRSLESTNLIESPFSALRRCTGRVGRWRSGRMVMRWVASALLEAEKGFKRISARKDLPALRDQLQAAARTDEEAEKAA